MHAVSFFSRNSDNIYIAVIFLVLGIVPTWLIAKQVAKRTPPNKALDVVILVNSAILTTKVKGTQRLQVLWDGGALAEPRLVILRVVNTGATAINMQEFEQAQDDQGRLLYDKEKRPVYERVRIDVTGGAVIASAEVAARSSDGVGYCDIVLSEKENMRATARLQFASLQKKEWIEIQLILDGPAADISAAARCDLALGRPRVLPPPTFPGTGPGSHRWWWTLLTISIASGFALILLALVQGTVIKNTGPVFWGPLVAFIASMFILSSLLILFITVRAVLRLSVATGYAREAGSPAQSTDTATV